VPVSPVPLSTMVVSLYVPPLLSQSDFSLACEAGAPIIRALNPIARCGEGGGHEVGHGSIVVSQPCAGNRGEARLPFVSEKIFYRQCEVAGF
jgi:hypothetical protein